jgi:hypothetical protein
MESSSRFPSILECFGSVCLKSQRRQTIGTYCTVSAVRRAICRQAYGDYIDRGTHEEPRDFSSCAFSSFHSLASSADVLPLLRLQMSGSNPRS